MRSEAQATDELSQIFKIDFTDVESTHTKRTEARSERLSEQEDETPQKQSSRAEKRRAKAKAKAKAKAEKAFAKTYGGASSGSPAGEASGGPRAALYKGEMGSKQRRATRMQSKGHGAGVSFSAPRGFALPSVSHRVGVLISAITCVVLLVGMLYTPAQQYYQQMRERDRLAAEYEAIQERNDTLQGIVDNLQTKEGVEDKAHSEFGLVNPGEEAGSVTGIDVVDTSKFSANIAPGSIPAPETWYSGVLDILFMYGG